jgi:Na+/proline symporter
MTLAMALVVGVYLILLFYSGRMGYRLSNSFADYVAGNWNMGLWLLMGTFSATWVSAIW